MRKLAREAAIFMLASSVVGAVGSAIWTWYSDPWRVVSVQQTPTPAQDDLRVVYQQPPVALPRAQFPTMWVIVDPFQEFGGTFVQPAPKLPKEITSRPCVPGSFLWHEKHQWVCVKQETRPDGLPDDLIAEPTNAH